ncbi:hypothetical protein PHMEG_00012211 [Phytophthora megakarya]|uniref:Uncharacterized protein n=1 Tax=Phytophthora megakarya TaxID=4795 RepID=A0A225W9C6_9STRA|nr:hypothetical protein PHMEG_00012211 [Phytophthora megakarya]
MFKTGGPKRTTSLPVYRIVPLQKTSRLNDTASSNHNGIQKEDIDDQDGRSETNNLTTSVSKSAQQSSIAAVKRDNRIRKTQEEAVAEILETSANIHREGIICLAEAILSRVQDNQNKKKKKLTKAYNLLYDEIMMNETAINDAAAYMKTLKDVDEVMAMEQQNEIMELVVSINKEKEKRSAALAQLIIHHWSSRMTILRSQLEGDPSKRRQGGASHEKLAAILSRPSKKPTGSRNVLTKRVLSVDEFRKERQIRARLNPPPPPVPGIPVPLYPGETQQQYNYKFTQWLAKKNESLGALQSDPKRERKLWLTFAFLREQSPTTAEKTPPKSHSSPSDTDQTLQSRSRTEILAPRVLSVEDYIREMKEPKLKRKDGKLAKIPVPLFTGETMNDYEQEFGRWLHGRQTSVLSLRYTPLKERVYRHQFAQQRSMKNTNTEQYRPQTHFESAQRKQNDKHKVNNADAEPPNNVLSPPLTITQLSKRTEVSTNADIHREATHNLAYSIQSRAQEDPKKQQLTEEYDHLNKQITLNETAIEDALDYIKAIKDVDEAVAMEQHSQIMELVVSINKEKERRVNALTALIIYTFAPKQNILRSLLDEESARVAQEGANHEKLGTIFSQIEEKDSVLETLEMHLNEQLQWVSEIPSDVSEAGKTLRFKALRKLSKRLIKEQTAKKQLECEREDMLKRCIQSDKTIRKSVREFLEVT